MSSSSSSSSSPSHSADKLKDAVRTTCGADIDDDVLSELVGTLQSNELPHEFQAALSLVIKASDSMHGVASPSPQPERRVTRAMSRFGSATQLQSPATAALASSPGREFHVQSIFTKPIDWVKSLIRGSNDEGAVLRIGDYTNLDPGWSEALVYWLKNYRSYPLLKFPNTPAKVAIEPRVRLGIVGDWGTGIFGDASTCPFLLVKKQLEEGAYDITIHLGDVYYAGTEDEERKNFVDHWPVGSKGSFTLNSNHEMYVGGRGYFQVALADEKFTKQQGTSFFALYNDDWLIFGLDSAFTSDKKDLFMKGNLNQEQLDFLRETRAEHQTQRVIILTHHDPITLKATAFLPLYDLVVQALGGVAPDFWYYGHVHNGIVYKPKVLESKTLFRCAGHGAIPYGATPELAEANDMLDWYEHDSAGDRTRKVRVLNGLVALTLEGNTLTETWISEQGDKRFVKVHSPVASK